MAHQLASNEQLVLRPSQLGRLLLEQDDDSTSIGPKEEETRSRIPVKNTSDSWRLAGLVFTMAVLGICGLLPFLSDWGIDVPGPFSPEKIVPESSGLILVRIWSAVSFLGAIYCAVRAFGVRRGRSRM